MVRARNAFGQVFTKQGEKRSRSFEGIYQVPPGGGPLVEFNNATSGSASFFVLDAKSISIRYHVTTGNAQAQSILEVEKNPDADFTIIVANVKHTISPGADANATASNIASAITSGASRTSAVAAGERVTMTRTDQGVEQNRRTVIVVNNVNSNGEKRFGYVGFFFDGDSTDSTNDATFNLHGTLTSGEGIGDGTSLFDTATTTGRTGSNVTYTFDESVIKPFNQLTASWSGLTAGDAISIYVKREF